MSGYAAIEASNLHRSFNRRSGLRSRRQHIAVDDITFAVPSGSIFSMLGPNGAGKTTTIKMLATLLVPTGGYARVNGLDVVEQDTEVRKQLGVVLGGDRGLYNKLSALDNLYYFGTLYGMSRTWLKQRAAQVLELTRLSDRATDRVETYSRGMKQRLHLARALLHEPQVLILDEPTIGLDPGSASEVRQAIRHLVPDRTILLTTHDMHEADTLSDFVVIVDKGRIVASGSPKELKAKVASHRRVEIRASSTREVSAALTSALKTIPSVSAVSYQSVQGVGDQWVLQTDTPSTALGKALGYFDQYESIPISIAIVEPSLEDAFLAVTGRTLE